MQDAGEAAIPGDTRVNECQTNADRGGRSDKRQQLTLRPEIRRKQARDDDECRRIDQRMRPVDVNDMCGDRAPRFGAEQGSPELERIADRQRLHQQGRDRNGERSALGS